MSLNIDGGTGTRAGSQPPIQTRPYDFGTDAIERQRVSLGQAMMDADFEYGLQATKWQSYVDIRKWPSFFEIPGTDYTVSNVASDGAPVNSNITIYYNSSVGAATAGPPPVGTYISIFGLANQARTADRAEGYYIVTSNSVAALTANYTAKGYIASGSNLSTSSTYSRRANVYNSGQVSIPFTSITTDGNANVVVTTSNAHGLLPGVPLFANTFARAPNETYSNFNGHFFVSNVTSANTFNIVASTYTFGNVGNVTTNLFNNTTLLVAQFASTQHRPYDGGVLLSTLSPAHGSTVVRQSKKAFRYQSGKGILFSSGTLFSPNLDIASVNLYGTTTTTTSLGQAAIYGINQTLNMAITPSANLIIGQVLTGAQGAGQTLGAFGTGLGTASISNLSSGPTGFTNVITFTGQYPNAFPPQNYPATNIQAISNTTVSGPSLLTGAVNIPCGGPLSNGFVLGQKISGLPQSLGTVTVSNIAQSNIQITFTGSWPLTDIVPGTQIFMSNTTTSNGTFNFYTSNLIPAVATSPISNGFASGQTIAGLNSGFGTVTITSNVTGTTANLIFSSTAGIPLTVPSGTYMASNVQSRSQPLQIIGPNIILPVSNLNPSANGFIAGQQLALGPSPFLANLGTVTCTGVGYGYLTAAFTGTANLISSNIPGGTWINLASNPTTGLVSQTWITGTTINLTTTAVTGFFAPGMNLIFSNLTGILTRLNANVLAINPPNLICYASGSGNIASINQIITGTLPQGNVAAGTFTPPTLSINASSMSNVITLAVSNTANYAAGQTLLGFSSNLGNCVVSSVSYTPALLGLNFTNAFSLSNTIPSGQSIRIVPPFSNTLAGTTNVLIGSMTIPVQSTTGFAPNMGIKFSNPSPAGFSGNVITSVGTSSITFSFNGTGGTIPALATVTGLTNVITTTGTTFVPAFNNIYVPLDSTTGFNANMFAVGLDSSFGAPVISNVFSTGIVIPFSSTAQIPTSLPTGTSVTGSAQMLSSAIFNMAVASNNLPVTSNTCFLTSGYTANQMLITGLPASLGTVTLAANAAPPFGTQTSTSLPLTFTGATALCQVSTGTLVTGTANTFSNGAAIATLANNFSLQVASTAGFLPGMNVSTTAIDGQTLQPLLEGTGNTTINVIYTSNNTLYCNFTGVYSQVATGNTVTYRNYSNLTFNIQSQTANRFALPVGSTVGFAPGQIVTSYLGSGMGTVTINSVPSSTVLDFTASGTYPTGNGVPIGSTVTTLPAGSILQVQTDVVHGIPTSGAGVTIRNFTTTAINGQYTISSVSDSRTVNVATTQALTSGTINLGDQPRLVVTNWHGSTVRAGCFDDANGLFWEYDGQTLAVVRRQSTFSCAGYVSVSPQSQILVGTTLTPNSYVSATTVVGFQTGIGETSNTFNMYGGGTLHNILPYQYCQLPGLGYAWVIGQPDFYQVTLGFLPTTSKVTITQAQLLAAQFWTPTTRFQDQFRVNDRFTVKGMVHQVTSIQGQGILTFNPPYRGAVPVTSAAPVKACKIKELRVPQAMFNRDTIDGKGPSGYKVDLSRQQMIGLQYTWYGAGFVDFMIRGPDGNWVYVHRIRNNNVNDEAYMRSGNLPVRYELCVESRGSVTSLARDMTLTDGTIYVNDPPSYFPPSNGYLLIDNEYIKYTGLTTTAPYSFTGCQRAAPIIYNINDAPRTFTGMSATTHLANTSVNLVSCSATPTMTHWGSSFLTDGGFDYERGYYFNYSNNSVTMQSQPGTLNVPLQPTTYGFSQSTISPTSASILSSLGGASTSFSGLGNVVFTATTPAAGLYSFALNGGSGSNCVVVFNSAGGSASYTAVPGPYPATQGQSNIISVGNNFTTSAIQSSWVNHVIGGVTISSGSLSSATFGGSVVQMGTPPFTSNATMCTVSGPGSTSNANCMISLAGSGTSLVSANSFFSYGGSGFTSTTGLTISQIVPTVTPYAMSQSGGRLTIQQIGPLNVPTAPGPYILQVSGQGGSLANIFFIIQQDGKTCGPGQNTVINGGAGFTGASYTSGLSFVAPTANIIPTIQNAQFSNVTLSAVQSTGLYITVNFAGTFGPLNVGSSVITDNTSGAAGTVAAAVAQTSVSPVQIFLNPSVSSTTFLVGDSVSFSGGQGSGTITAVNTTNSTITVSTAATSLTGGTLVTDGSVNAFSQNVPVSVASSGGATAFAIRLAPSVANGLVGDIGVKELLNRAQILLQKLEVTSPQNIQTIGYFNPQGVNYMGTWQNINSLGSGGQPSFTQFMAGGQISGTPTPGERIFQTIVQGNNQNNLDLTGIKEMANSTIGGNQSFPDGPDILLIYCQNLTNTLTTAQVNLFWSEAQA
jgi:hypothetical protein